MDKYIYRFVTPEAILIAKREKEILKRQAQGRRGPVGAIRLDVKDTIDAFLDYFDTLGQEGWIYTGMVEYPDLPYGGCYVFRKIDRLAKGIREMDKNIMKKVEAYKQEEDDYELTPDEYFRREEDKEREAVALDLTRERESVNKDLMDAPASVVNEIIRKQQRVIHGDEKDPDLSSDVIEEMLFAQKHSDEVTPQHEMSDSILRKQLYDQYQQKNPGKKAIHRGKETAGFKSWLDRQRAEYDPYYKEFEEETGNLALHNEKETQEYKDWFKENKVNKDESGHQVPT